MDPTFLAGLASRWVHISCAIILLGGMFYALNLSRAGAGPKSIADGFRAAMPVLAALLAVSGLYNFLNKAPVPRGYHMIFGIKVLLFLHIAAISIIVSRAGLDASKRIRLLAGAVLSGFVIVALSAYLRGISA